MKLLKFTRRDLRRTSIPVLSVALALALLGHGVHTSPARAATAMAQTASTTSAPTAASKENAVAKAVVARPTWKQLSPEQQVALAPLNLSWDSLSKERKRKWLALSKNFHAMPASEQALLHSRMRDWVQLSQKQRAQARLNYAETRSMSAEEKAEQWRSYLRLSSEERQHLAAKAPASSGAAVVRPLPAEKLPHPALPASHLRSADAKGPKLPIHRNTLLPVQPPKDGPDLPSASPTPVSELKLTDPATAAPR